MLVLLFTMPAPRSCRFRHFFHVQKEAIPLAPTIIGFIGSLAVSLFAWRREALSFSGALAAIVVGTVLFGAGSPAWFGTLLVFFVTSSALSKGKKQRKQTAESGYEKGSRRDAGQVLANGGPGAALCLLWAAVAGEAQPGGWWTAEAWWYAFVGVMASVTADTWATEVGALSRREPVTVIGFRRVPRGTSGAVSPLGTLAAAGGAVAIGLSAWAFVAAERALLPALDRWAWLGSAGWLAMLEESLTANWAAVSGGFALVPAAFIGGVAGAFADSLIGATLQRMNRCTVCGRLVEQAAHCGKPTERVRGLKWMNNDAVNAISSAVGGLAAILVGYLIG